MSSAADRNGCADGASVRDAAGRWMPGGATGATAEATGRALKNAVKGTDIMQRILDEMAALKVEPDIRCYTAAIQVLKSKQPIYNSLNRHSILTL